MGKLILSGDLGTFRLEMLVRILEALKLDGEIALEAVERAQVSMLGGKVVGAKSAADQGLPALLTAVTQRAGTFSVRQLAAEEVARQSDLQALPDNAAIFRQVHAQAGPGRVVQAAQAPQAAAVPPGQAQTVVQKGRPGAVAGPMGRVPEMTDKGKITLRSIQTNFALRGVQVEADTWRILSKINGSLNLYQISSAVGIMGDRFSTAVDELTREGYVRFQAHDPGLDVLANRPTEGKFRFGEYMIAKGIITEVQLEAALRRQQELARRGRYMWLGEILIEMNYARPSQVQEALAVQKRMSG